MDQSIREEIRKLGVLDMDESEAKRLSEENEKLKQEMAVIKQATKAGLGLRISAKGGISLYGLQRLPVTIYADQWIRLLDYGPCIRQFIEDHKGEYRTKEDAAPEES